MPELTFPENMILLSFWVAGINGVLVLACGIEWLIGLIQGDSDGC